MIHNKTRLAGVSTILMLIFVACGDPFTDPPEHSLAAPTSDDVARIIRSLQDTDTIGGQLNVYLNAGSSEGRRRAAANLLRAFPDLQMVRGVTRYLPVAHAVPGQPMARTTHEFVSRMITVNLPPRAHQVLERLMSNPNVAFVSANDRLTPAIFGEAEGVRLASGSAAANEVIGWGVQEVNAPSVWQQGRGDTVDMAYIDTGADILYWNGERHPDMAPTFLVNFVNDYSDNSCPDDTDHPCYWESPPHGSGPISVAQAWQNDTLMVGIAPSRLMHRAWALKTLYLDSQGNESMYIRDMADAISYVNDYWNRLVCFFSCTRNNIRIGNIGIGWDPEYDPTLFAEIQAALDEARSLNKTLWISSSGKYSFIGTDGVTYDGPWYPAILNNVISVSSLKQDGSRWGPKRIDLVAPTDVPAAWNRFDMPNGYHVSFGGTSAASPHVAGVAALVMSMDSSLTASALESCLLSTATDLGPAGWDEGYGWGVVNAAQAVSCVTPGN